MQIQVLKSKIHRATVTEANINYVGSITIDEDLMNESNLIEFEKVQVLNINNGERIETYVIKGERGSGTICLNGAAARLASKGDIVIILTYHEVPHDQAPHVKPRMVYVDEHNRIKSTKIADAWMNDLVAAK